jgi:hypothetical protein
LTVVATDGSPTHAAPSGRLVLDYTFTSEPRIDALTDSELGVWQGRHEEGKPK